MALISLKKLKKKLNSKTFEKFYSPIEEIAPDMPEQKSGGNKPIEFDSESNLQLAEFARRTRQTHGHRRFADRFRAFHALGRLSGQQ